MSASALINDRADLLTRVVPRGLGLDRRRRTLQWVGRLLLAAALCLTLVAGVSRSAAQWSEMKMQEPWAYTHRFDEANEPQFMATTPAAEDAHIWLLLVCKSDERIYVSFIHSGGFPYALRERAHLTLQLDSSEPVSLPTVAIQQKQIAADPRRTRDLIPALMQSNRLSASIIEMDGTVHTYSFSLQPNDLALRDIDVHCDHSAP